MSVDNSGHCIRCIRFCQTRTPTTRPKARLPNRAAPWQRPQPALAACRRAAPRAAPASPAPSPHLHPPRPARPDLVARRQIQSGRTRARRTFSPCPRQVVYAPGQGLQARTWRSRCTAESDPVQVAILLGQVTKQGSQLLILYLLGDLASGPARKRVQHQLLPPYPPTWR